MDFYERITKSLQTAFTFLLCAVLMTACGSSRQSQNVEDEVDIDQLLGGEPTSSTRSTEEDEVLRLLGISPGEREVVTMDSVVQAEESRVDKLEGDIDRLTRDLAMKDQEITKLRTELSQRDEKIKNLETAPRPRGGAYGEPSPEFQAKYQAALAKVNARNYNDAIEDFTELLRSDSGNSLSDNCQYWMALAYYGQQNYNQAIVNFEKVFTFANSNKNDDAQLMLGMCYLKLGNRNQARADFEQLVANYPSSEYRTLAEKYIGQL